MSREQSSINPSEIAKFAKLADDWWDKNGSLKTLHDINDIRLDYIQKFVSLQGESILDIGCGGGILSEGMAKCGGLVTGLDVEEDSIATARSHAALDQLPIQYECIPVELYQGPPSRIVTCLEMLEHVDDPAFVIKHAARLLTADGYLFLSTINRTVKSYAYVVVGAEYILGLLPRQTHDFKKFIKPSELASMVRMAGLDVIEMTGLSYNPFTRVASLSSCVDMNYLLVCRFCNGRD